ncbi:SLC26/SulP family anion transporter [Sporobolomyces koalae]|uniref:SLC26/SulP family anion transporter n=1 Tax=Sporobolomyces koalae TaxID=500713 RepID=UPI00317930D0
MLPAVEHGSTSSAPLPGRSEEDTEGQSTRRSASTASKRPRQKLETCKEWFKSYIGYDSQVVEAASVTDTVKRAVSGNVVAATASYVHSLFPVVDWIGHYPWHKDWWIGDVVAGITVALVLVPQSMSYAKIATLAPQYGLYSSFVGVLIYPLFATSKDVTIGPVAVASLEVARVIAHVQNSAGGDVFSGPEIATALAFLCGLIVLGIGLLRIGWLIEFIPTPSIAGFMTGSALQIFCGQVPVLLGYSNKLNTRASTYKVIINTLKHLPDTKLDAAYGLSGLAFLYVARYTLRHIEQKARNPIIKRIAFFATTLRTAFVIIMLTVFSWVHLRHKAVADYDISILKSVPSGFQELGQPKLPTKLLSLIAPQLPVSTIILLLEHIAIAKSFGRVNNYRVRSDQELVAIGVSNMIGTMFAAYPATGSFSRSAIKAKAGVRTPLAGWITGVGVLVALYALTSAFYWIPNAALAAVIIHAVLDLVASPATVYSFWKVSPLEAVVFMLAVIVSVFSTIEIGIYVSVGASVALLLFRIARPRGAFLGRVRLRAELEDAKAPAPYRDVYVPLKPNGSTITNPLVLVEPPPPGIIVFRFEESFLYPNAAFYTDVVLDYAKQHTRSGQVFDGKGDRNWNDPGPHPWLAKLRARKFSESKDELKDDRPILRAVVFDFSSVSHVDSTSLQNLVDLKRSLERWASDTVQFHFASILSPYIKRALLAGGFGTGTGWTAEERPLEIAPVVNEGRMPVLTEHARRVQAKHFQRRYPPSTASGTATPRAAYSSLDPLTELDRGNVTDGQGSIVDGQGRRTSDPEIPDIAEETDRDVEAARTGDAVFDLEKKYALPTSHLGGHVWASSFPGQEEAHEEAPIVSHLFPRFHLDLSSAVAAAVGGDW